jgi:CBS-domain-containing membrane protein
MYLFGFIVVLGGVLAALWKLGVLQHIDKTWIAIGVAVLVGIGIMLSVGKSGVKENIQIDRK